MFYLPISLLLYLFLLILLPIIWFGLAIDVVTVAVSRLGFSREVGILLLFSVLVGSMINIPLYKTQTEITLVDDMASLWIRQFFGIPLEKVQQTTIIALNVGGGLIPLLLSLYQFSRTDPVAIGVVTLLVTLVSYFSAHVVPGIGIQMNPLLSPIAAALFSFLIMGDAAAPVAFAGGVLGTVIGADLLHIPEILRKSPGILSIGGAGVFDGIALCGLFALLLT